MAQVQTAEVTVAGTVTVRMGVSGAPYLAVERITPQGNSTLVPFEYSLKRVVDLVAVGYDYSDPQGYVTCHCGAWKDWRKHECTACEREWQDYQSECQMYADLREE